MKQLTLFDLFDEQQNQFCTSETRLEIACKPSKSPEGLLQLGEAAIGNIADVEKQSNLSSGITASNKSASDLNQAPKYEPQPKVEHTTPMDYNTPMMRQWKMIKEQYPDALLLFRCGDFYEIFYEDAEKACKILNITLTRRNNPNGTTFPMAGFPFHALDTYLPKLVRAGYRVAICDQKR